MRIIMISVLIGLGLCQPLIAQMTSRYTPYQLDNEEAFLNKNWQRVEDVASAHARYQKIREKMIIQAYYKPMTDWFSELSTWLKGWDPVIEVMKGDALGDDEQQTATLSLVKSQLTKLDQLNGKIPEINRKANQAYKSLSELPIFPADYIDILQTTHTDSYGPQIQIYVGRVQAAKTSLMSAQESFAAEMTQGLREMTIMLNDAVVLKMKALQVRFPKLKESVARIEAALVQLRVVDTVILRYQTEGNEIAKKVIDEKIFTAQNQANDWVGRIRREISIIEGNSEISNTAAKFGRDALNGMIRVQEAQIADQVRARSKLRIFASFYMREMYGPFGLVKACMRSTQPAAIDCNRLRLIQGFKQSQLMQLNDTAAEFMEVQILKAKGLIL